MLCSLSCEVRHRERVPAICEDHVGVEVSHRRVQLFKSLRLAALDPNIADPSAEELVLEPWNSKRVGDVNVEQFGPKLRERVVEGELFLLRPPSPVPVPEEAEREDRVLQAVPLAEPEVHVVQRVVVVPAVRVHDPRDVLELAVVARDDLEDGDGLLAPDVHPPLDLADLLHLVEDLQSLPHVRNLGGRGTDEEGGLEVRVLDAVGPVLVPEPEDDCVLVVVRIRVDEPALRGATPPCRGIRGRAVKAEGRGEVAETAPSRY